MYKLLEYMTICIGICLATTGYTVIGEMFGILPGIYVPLPLILAGVLCIFLAIVLSQLAQRYPTAPGVRTYIRAAFGDKPSLVATFMLISVVVLFAGAEAYIFTVSINIIYDVSPYVVVPLVIAFVVAVNLFGLDMPRKMQLIMTLMLVTGLIVLGIYASLSTESQVNVVTDEDMIDALAIVSAAGTAIFLFMGFEWVLVSGKHPNDYKRTIPLAMVLGISVLLIAYLVLSYALSLRFQDHEVSGTMVPHFLLANLISTEHGAYIVILLSLFAMVTTFNAGLMGVSRLMYTLGREGVLPPVFTKISMKTGVPVGAVLTLGLLAEISALIQLATSIHEQVLFVCAAIYCLIYSLYPLSNLRIINNDSACKNSSLKMNIFKVLSYCASVLFIVFGIGALLNSEEYVFDNLVIFTMVVIASCMLSSLVMKQSQRVINV